MPISGLVVSVSGIVPDHGSGMAVKAFDGVTKSMNKMPVFILIASLHRHEVPSPRVGFEEYRDLGRSETRTASVRD